MTNHAAGDGPGFRVRTSNGPTDRFHRTNPADTIGHEAWVHIPDRPVLVLGSTQPDRLVDADRAEADGIEVCRRRSGGGLVHVSPATDCWVDLVIPVGSPLWDDDVGRAFHWVGDTWAGVLAETLRPGREGSQGAPEVPVEPLVHRRADGRNGRLWCFGAVGHGEITVDGSKILGLSQRRTRTWVRIQSLVCGPWHGEVMGRYTNPDVARTVVSGGEVADPARLPAGLPTRFAPFDPADLARRFVSALPRP